MVIGSDREIVLIYCMMTLCLSSSFRGGIIIPFSGGIRLALPFVGSYGTRNIVEVIE
jgi:hypothetical protein